ncbi:hypothetical protein GWK47_036786 [Chionoecetes opilio]|uniref:Uncharacterized protein n=1 Tax=Chionoecetes opilio TaxID=41210 RepID=A0A8J4YM99_CHIOP|nr:hypothetical protein GWK47_036786 [Chionoecetes opilio]
MVQRRVMQSETRLVPPATRVRASWPVAWARVFPPRGEAWGQGDSGGQTQGSSAARQNRVINTPLATHSPFTRGVPGPFGRAHSPPPPTMLRPRGGQTPPEFTPHAVPACKLVHHPRGLRQKALWPWPRSPTGRVYTSLTGRSTPDRAEKGPVRHHGGTERLAASDNCSTLQTSGGPSAPPSNMPCTGRPCGKTHRLLGGGAGSPTAANQRAT